MTKIYAHSPSSDLPFIPELLGISFETREKQKRQYFENRELEKRFNAIDLIDLRDFLSKLRKSKAEDAYERQQARDENDKFLLKLSHDSIAKIEADKIEQLQKSSGECQAKVELLIRYQALIRGYENWKTQVYAPRVQAAAKQAAKAVANAVKNSLDPAKIDELTHDHVTAERKAEMHDIIQNHMDDDWAKAQNNLETALGNAGSPLDVIEHNPEFLAINSEGQKQGKTPEAAMQDTHRAIASKQEHVALMAVMEYVSIILDGFGRRTEARWGHQEGSLENLLRGNPLQAILSAIDVKSILKPYHRQCALLQHELSLVNEILQIRGQMPRIGQALTRGMAHLYHCSSEESSRESLLGFQRCVDGLGFDPKREISADFNSLYRLGS